MWWPNIRKDIEGYVNDCEECIKARHIRCYSLKSSALPKNPWQTLGADLFEFKGRDYLILVDYFSRWIKVAELSNKTAVSSQKDERNVC